MIRSSTIQLLRFPFSIFLMPVYWFALSQVPDIDISRAILVFCILHVLVYPASNGYNSYMDRDTDSIGGVENPQQPTRQLFHVTVGMDILACLLSLLISPLFCIGLITYIVASRAYSFRGIRLKQYPVIGYLTVVIFQGAVTFFLVMHGSSTSLTTDVPIPAMIVASLLIGGFYPLTQIYQHRQDQEDGVTSISMLLGYRGTFIFTAIIYALAMGILAFYLFSTLQETGFFILQIFFVPILVYFIHWFRTVTKNTAAADFKHTMKMNLLASICSNAAFITLLIIEKI